jgi:hypothetical protein
MFYEAMFQTAGSFDVEVRRVIEDHQAFYEVTPYYVLFEERPPGGHPSSRRIQAGFDIDIFGIVSGPAPEPSPEYEVVSSKPLARRTLRVVG